MLENQLFLAGIALGLGFVVGVVLFVPFVALSYRRRGKLELGRTALWAAALVYFWSIWTFTLLPLPAPGEIQCAGINLQLLAMRENIAAAIDRNHGVDAGLLSDAAILQIALNVVLFMPLGFFLRVLGNRGIILATLAGLGTSLLVELTQLTGVWGLYPCAYRVFDVDDLVVNTVGALLGSVLALVIPGARGGRVPESEVHRPQPVTHTRRMIAMVCDLLAYTLLTVTIDILIRAVLTWGVDRRDLAADTGLSTEVSVAVVFAVFLLGTLITGRTPGDAAVQVRYTGGPVPEFPARILRFLGGIGGYALLHVLGFAGLASVLALLGLVAWMWTSRGRGTPGLVSGQHMVDRRELVPVAEGTGDVQDWNRST